MRAPDREVATMYRPGRMGLVAELPSFHELAESPEPPLDMLALALAAEFRVVEAGFALDRLDALGAELAEAVAQTEGGPREEARACADVLAGVHGFTGDAGHYDDPENSMLDVVLERRRGLPILLSVVYVEVARRAGVPLVAVGLPGHFVVAHRTPRSTILLDPFTDGGPVRRTVPAPLVRAWTAPEIALRMLNNLVGSFRRRADLGRALRAASMRLELPAPPAEREAHERELRSMQARLN
jgi:regulator of sirC expression with transglutaminase-like and TPR domain